MDFFIKSKPGKIKKDCCKKKVSLRRKASCYRVNVEMVDKNSLSVVQTFPAVAPSKLMAGIQASTGDNIVLTCQSIFLCPPMCINVRVSQNVSSYRCFRVG